MNYAWLLNMVDGAVGIGYKPLSEFYLWPVRGKKERRLDLDALRRLRRWG